MSRDLALALAVLDAADMIGEVLVPVPDMIDLGDDDCPEDGPTPEHRAGLDMMGVCPYCGMTA